MADYEIIASYPEGGKAAYRKRYDAANLRLQVFVYEVMHAFSLRDRQIAHDFMNWAKHLPPPPVGEVYSKKQSDFSFSIERLS